MKTLRTLFLGIGALAATLTFNSCLDDDGYPTENSWVGIATVKPLSSSESYFLQLDDSTTLLPVTGRTPSFSVNTERRALVNFTLLSDSAKGYNHAIRVNEIDSILTKSIVPSLGEENDSIYGKDAIDLDSKGLWIEDGYITFQFKTYFGGGKHFLNLVQMDETKPYELEFRHNAFNDPKSSIGWGLVSFRLNTLPNTEGKTVKLKVKYISYDGEKTYELDYNSSKPNSGKAPSFTSKDFQTLK